ncbi:MAG: universal stress protein [Haliscomenobacter sp.]
MRKIQKIIFPTDFSATAQHAFLYCLQLADRCQAEITLLHVVYPEYEVLDLPVMATKATHDKLEAARDALQSFAAFGIHEAESGGHLSRLPVVQQEVEVGATVGIIAKVADRDEADLIVMGTQGMHNALERTLGSVSTGVVEHAHCPVLVIPEHARWKPIQVMAYATDLSHSGTTQIERSIELMAPFHPVIHVVHVANNGNSGEDEKKLAELEAFFNMSTHPTEALQLNFHQLDRDSVTDGLRDFVEYYEVDLLAMFAPRHNLIERLFTPSITRKMVFEAPIPILLIKNE